MKPTQKLIEKAISSKRESKTIEFKESFDISSSQDWCETIKDIVAISNSGGGIIVFGLKSDGVPSAIDCSYLLNLDSASITDKINKYTDCHFQDFELEELEKNGYKIVGLVLYESRIPMVFTKPGTYSIQENKQKTAFSQGTVYFRHGAKSEPCNSNDLKEVIERNLEQIKTSWLGNIRKVVSAPIGSNIAVLPSTIEATSKPDGTPIRITNDGNAPAYKLVDPNITHPYRGKDVLNLLNTTFGIKLNSFHLQCLRKKFNLEQSRPDYFYKPMFGSPQFSEDFLTWLKESYSNDNDFFENVRQEFLKH